MSNTTEFVMADSFFVSIHKKPLFKFISIPDHINVLDGFQTEISLFRIKPAFCEDFYTKFE